MNLVKIFSALIILMVAASGCSFSSKPPPSPTVVRSTDTPRATWLDTRPPGSATPTQAATNTPLPTSTRTQQPTPLPTKTPTRQPTSTPRPTSTPTFTPPPTGSLQIGDWARVSVDPPRANNLRSQPNLSSVLLGKVQPGENVLVVDGPRQADGYTWWLVRNLTGLEGWTAEGDGSEDWLVEPISAWHPLPEPLVPLGARTFALRELDISADLALVSQLTGKYLPLATPLPTPLSEETPFPNDPRGDLSMGWTAAYAAHSDYEASGALAGSILIYELEDPLSRFYLNRMRATDCTQSLRQALEKAEIPPASLNPFCGVNGAIPLHFVADVQKIPFSGGKGVRFLISSANYLVVNQLYYVFQGLSEDGRYFIHALFSPIFHPYLVNEMILQEDFGPLLGWKEGQYEQATESYQVFNARIETLLNARAVTLYPALELLDNMLASIVMK